MAEDGIQARVVGFEELRRGSLGLADKIGKSAGPAMEKGAGAAADRVRSTVPRLTGALAGSVTTGSGDGGSAYVGMGEGLDYAGWIEYGGTRGRPYVDAGRYVYPAAEATQGLVVESASRQTQREIEAYPWSTPTTS